MHPRSVCNKGKADKVIRVGGDAPWILYAELQASRDDTLPSRTLQGSIVVSERHAMPVKSVVLLLRPAAEEKRNPLTGLVRRVLPGEGSSLEFRYTVVRVWDTSPEVFLNAGLGLLPLAPLAKVTQRGLPKLIRRMEARIASEADKAPAAELWTSTYVLMGLRYPEAVTSELLRGVRDLEESVTYQAIIKKGEAQGRAEGEAREARKLLLRVGRRRLGEPDAATQDAIAAFNDRNTLESLNERILEVESWAELLASSHL